MSQSTVTMHIQALERELDAPLFDRIGRRVVLTEVGRRTIDYAHRLLALADETKVAVRKHGELSGPVSIGASEVLVACRLPEALRTLQKLHPKIQLTLTSRSDSDEYISAILGGTLDFAIILSDLVESDRLVARTVGKDEIIAVAAPAYRIAGPGVRTLLPSGQEAWLNRMVQAFDLRLGASGELGSIEAVKQCAIAGMGVAVLPKMTVETELKDHVLICVQMFAPTSIPIQLVRNRDRWMSPAFDAVWNAIEQAFVTGS